MNKVIVNVKRADYYDTVQIFVDGVPYGKQRGNSTFEISVPAGKHIIHGIYDNMEPEYAGYSHALGSLEFEVKDKDVRFNVEISNIFSGGKITKC